MLKKVKDMAPLTLVIVFTAFLHLDAASLEDNGVEPVRRPREFCKTMKYNYSVTSEGCETKYIDNNACYGQCLSEYNTGYMTCKACWPTDLRERNVTLKCKNNVMKIKTVKIVMFCQCTRRKCPEEMPGYGQNTVQSTAQPVAPTTEQLREVIRKVLRRRRRRCKEKRSSAKRRCLRKFKECKRKLRGLLSNNERRKRSFEGTFRQHLDKIYC